MDQYKPDEKLFPWTDRNLEYVLTNVGREAGLEHMSFEMLRWTCAVRDYAEGMDPQKLRNKLGLSQISWYEVETKLAILARRASLRLAELLNILWFHFRYLSALLAHT